MGVCESTSKAKEKNIPKIIPMPDTDKMFQMKQKKKKKEKRKRKKKLRKYIHQMIQHLNQMYKEQ